MDVQCADPETTILNCNKQVDPEKQKQAVALIEPERLADSIAGRIAEVLDKELAEGRLPA